MSCHGRNHLLANSIDFLSAAKVKTLRPLKGHLADYVEIDLHLTKERSILFPCRCQVYKKCQTQETTGRKTAGSSSIL